jgi:hypothetical protein
MKHIYLLALTFFLFPLNLYAQRLTLAGPGETTAACDQRYALEMQLTLDRLQGTMPQDRLQLAQQYMIMVKQHQDLDFRIRQIERRVFDVPTIARLRTPLQEYQRCIDTLISRRTEY